ncbi:potassium voltage-gated channel protein [Chloropicon primus]|uniref:Potassium voltage-gated channel protein n=1 Tax=Chloropicon primus TaxID=1764295 RepID=A0A5B8MNT5_9CHLO|nr:potassium voltage-gated channel protein [Chloropicon primus]UPR01410.1 potassium voltage-gated channel protein [Chloropicon primus]|eukprot:QDZ22193.1 potassium voltage-gated channel protein [Chloropicon primus]
MAPQGQRQPKPHRHSLKRASITEFKMGKNRSASMFHESRLREERRESSMKSLAMKDLPVEMLKKMNSSKNNNLLANVKIPDKTQHNQVLLFGVDLSRFVIAADAVWKSRWDWSVICLVLYTAVFIPYSFSFQHEKLTMQEALDYLIDFIFIIDIVFSFFTAYFDKRGDEIQDLIMIRKKYFSEWFVIDFVAAFPFEAIAIMSNLNLNVSILNLFKIPRLLRLGRLMKKLDQLAGANAFRIVKLLCGFALFTHWIACVWYFIGRFQDEGNIWTGSVWLVRQNLCQTVKGPGNWVDNMYVSVGAEEVGTKHLVDGVVACIDVDDDANKMWRVDDFMILTNSTTCIKANQSLIETPEFCNEGIATITPDATPFTKYIASFYWALTTLTTVGYGDIQPQTNTERAFVVFVMLGGALMYASIFGNVAVLIQTFDAANARYKEKLDQLKEFATYYDLDEKLHAKLVKYIQKHQHVTNGLDCESFLESFPVSVRGDVAVAMREKFVSEVKRSNTYMGKPEFEVFLKAMLAKMRPQICLKYDYILRKGEVGKEMYFIARGCVGVLKYDLIELDNTSSDLVTDAFDSMTSAAAGMDGDSLTNTPRESMEGSPSSPHTSAKVKKHNALKNAVAVKLGPGEHFGEMALFDEERWGASVVALSFCELHILHFYDFKELERDYTAEMMTMRKFAEKRNKKKTTNDEPGVVALEANAPPASSNLTPAEEGDSSGKGDEIKMTNIEGKKSESEERIVRLEHRLQLLESRVASRAERLEEQLIRIINTDKA